jgi:hypothetical protein
MAAKMPLHGLLDGGWTGAYRRAHLRDVIAIVGLR